MSSETASSTCVGTSTSSLSHVEHQQEQQQQLILAGQSSFESPTVASRDGEEDTRSMAAADMDLVNGLNPWLPAYGFQLQHQQHNQHFQPTHEDLRANDAALVQQVDFLETIVEETSDDLQSDSDRSGTTYWLGSDSETESVIHIKANQRAADERPDGSGSECNSVVPKKRRRRNASQDRDASMTLADEQWTSPRSSRSSESSSRSSSLLQFESLERTCATVSPSGYSYDSLEYSNRSNSHFENTSPDSLEEDCDEEEAVEEEEEERTRNERVNGFPVNGRNGFAKLRPYRSFESLDTCHKSEVTSSCDLSNGFSASFYSKTSNDLSAGGLRNDQGQRDFWHENEPYEEDDEYEEDDDEEDIEEEEETSTGRESRRYDPYEERVGLLSFTDCSLPSYSTSLDFRNTIDLREIGIETKRDAVLDLKAGQVSTCSLLLASSASSRLLQTARLNIAGVVDGCGVSGVGSGSGNNMASSGLSGSGLLHRHHHHHHQHHHHHHHPPQRQQKQQQQHQHQRGWSNSSDFNFRFTDKSRSAPSLPSGFDESSSSSYPSGRSPRSSDYYPGTSIGTVSSSSLFENYTRVASVPVDLNLCGRDDDVDVTNNRDNESAEEYDQDVTITNEDYVDDDREPLENRLKAFPHEMADDSGVSGQSSIESSKSSERTDSSMSSSSSLRRRKNVGENDDGKAVKRTPSVRTQSRPEVTEVSSEDAAGSGLLSTIDADAGQAAKMHLDREKVIASTEAGGDQAEEEEEEDASESGVAESSGGGTSPDPEPPRSTVKTQDRGHNVLEIAMAMENDIDAVVDEAIRQFKREVEEATGAGGGNTALLAMEAMQRLSSGRQQSGKPCRRVKNNASYELAQQFEVDERNFRHTGRMTSCAEDDAVETPPSSPGGGAQSPRRRVLNNASYELAQQQDYIKLLQSKTTRPFQRMDACDERQEVPRPTIACGIKVADLVREMSREPNSSIATSGIFSEEEIVPEERKVDEVFAKSSNDQQAIAGRHDDHHQNHVSPRSKNNVARAEQQQQQELQQDSIIGQIKKNSDLFSLYGESGSCGARTVGRVEANNDDEVDYPCLENKPILNNSDNFNVDVRRALALDEKTSRATGDNKEENAEWNSGMENEGSSSRQYYEELTDVMEEPANRGLCFLGEFYPETKNNISRLEKNPSSPQSEFHKQEIEALAAENNEKSTTTKTNSEKIERIEREPAGDRLWRVVVEKQQCSSSDSSASDRNEAPEGGTEDSIESVVEAATVSAQAAAATAVVVEAASEDAEVEEARQGRRKECAYVGATGTVGLNSTGSTVHGAVGAAVTTATRTSPPPLITSDRIGVGRALERNGGSSTDDENRETTNAKYSESVVARREDKDDLDGDDGDDEEEEEEEQQQQQQVAKRLDWKTIETTTTTTTKKSKSSGSPEMSATAAKRLAMASPPGPPRNNNDHSPITTKNDFTPQKNNSPVNERKKGGLGGFLQRFSRLRFSGRSKVPRSEVTKKNEAVVIGSGGGGGEVPANRTAGVKLMDEQPGTTRRKKEPDYIIIPLHAPEDERRTAGALDAGRDEGDAELRSKPRRSTDLERSASCASPNGRPPVSSKPPLPPSHHQGGGGARSVGATTPTSRSSSGVGGTRRRAATDLGSSAAIEMAKARAMQAAQEPRPVGLLETDLDAAEPAVLHVDLSGSNGASAAGHAVSSCNSQAAGKKTRSLLNLNHTSSRQGRDGNHHLVNDNALRVPQSPGSGCRNTSDHQDHHHNSVGTCINQRPHKSMEFLLDKENLHFVKPPENELQKVGERVPSEHELRVQRSLQRLNVPDWYKNSPAARDGFRLKRHSDASQHGGWRSLGSKTTSLSSLSSSSNRQPTTGVLLSPSPTPPVFSRWSTSLLNSAGSSPASSARSSFNHRQPYLGWRSQERLANPRTPAERLAQGILPQLQSTKKQQQQQQNQQKEQANQQLEVRNSIKEVTSAIVHYVQSGQEVAGGGRLSPRPRPDDWDDRGGARSTSPRGSVRLCWMESSFVGSRPVDSPETPMSLATDTECCAGCNATGTESCSCVDSATSGLYLDLTPTRDEPQQQHLRGSIGQQQQQQQYQQHGTRSLCPSPSSSATYHPHLQHHHHHVQHHQQQHQQQQHQRHHRGSGQSEDEEAMATAALLRNKPSPGSTTLEDVLDSLLGLPSASRTPSPGPGPLSGSTSIRHHRAAAAAAASAGQPSAKAGKSCSDLRQDLQESARGGSPDSPGETNADGPPRASSYYVGELVRRKSEGSDIVPPHRSSSRSSNLRNRRVSFDNAQNNDSAVTVGVTLAEKLVRCRNNKCNNATTVAEARRVYKSCHNCTCLYCSRECRRAHWQRHRRTCLHSRAGTLCRQVLSSAKEDPATLRHISALAQRGYASHGRGAVKCFFSSPEVAEQFVSNGFVDLGEPTYVRWSDLLPSEMGAELYAEVMRLCKSYNPETRLVLYVAVCVVSEVPSSGAVRWERQLVSRCGKIRLDSSCRQPSNPVASSTTASPQGRQQTASPCNITREMDSPETLVLTSMPERDGQNTPRSAREIGFTNIQRQLRLRGVSLRRHFPQVYTKLCSYVDGTVDKFAPVTIYPRDQASGKSFMCIIMLDAEPERLQLLPTDSSRVRTVDISVEQE